MDRIDPSAATGPCTGVRVVDFSTVISGPLCTQILGDLGADVVKVESPGGDFSRHTPPVREGLSGFFASFNRNKRSIAVDLKSDAGRDVARRLCSTADVVVENFRPGVADRLGIGWSDLSPGNERLIYVSINGFGSDGPYASQPAYDLVIQALVGIMPVQGGEQSPVLMKSLVADKCSAMTAANGVLGALLHRERNGGGGQKIEIPMLDAFAAYVLPDLLMTQVLEPQSEVPPAVDIYRTFATRDGHVTGIIIQDDQFEGFCRAINREDLLERPEFKTLIGRIIHADEFFALCESELAKWSTADFIERARKFGAPMAPVQTIAEFLDDPQTRHNGIVFEAQDPRGGRTRMLRHPVRYGESPASLRRHPPRIGEHTDEILAEAGLDAEAVQQLRKNEAVS
ncbi:MAG: CoA transferase [Myxococcales bacterium]|nr:CoA transferase [Myxococcales bacterium]